MPAEAPPDSLPVPPASAPDQTGATSSGVAFGLLLKGVAAGLGITPESAAAFVGEVLRPIIRQEIQDAFAMMKDTAEIGGTNDALEKSWNDPAPASRVFPAAS